MRIEFRILGPLEVDAEGRVLPLGSPKQRALLALLLIHANETVSRDRLIEELWGDAAPASVESAFHVYLSRLRRLLDSAGCGALLVRQAHGYTLRVGQDQLDATRFAALAGEGREALAAGEAGRAADRLRRALALWRGPALADLESEGFALAEAARLEEERVAALEQRLEADLALGRDQELIGELEALVAEHPYRERVHAQLILALYRCGRQAEALRAYQQARRTLADELGLKPGHELKELEQAILRQDPTLMLQRPARLQTEPARPAPEPAPVPVVERERETVPARRLWRGTALGAIAVALALMGAAAVAVVATRAGDSRETTVSADAVGLIDADKETVQKSIDVHTSPFGVAIGFGAVWVTNANDGTVSRIDPDAGSVTQTIGVGNSPSGIAVGGGSIWVANHDDGTVSRISPQTNTVVDLIPVGAAPTAVAADRQSVWVTNAADRTVTRIDAGSGKAAKPIRTGALGRGIAVGGGSVWVTDESSRRVIEIDEESGDVLGPIPVGNGPSGIAYRDGALWVANSLDRTVYRIDARVRSVRAAIPVGGSPSGVAVGPDGVWVTLEFAERIVRIDPGEGRVTSSLDVANRPKGIAVDGGDVWVAVQASGRGHRGGRLVTLSTPFDTIDPTLASDTVSSLVTGLVYDGLTTFRRVGGSEGTQLVPDLAANLPTVGEGGKTFTFRLRRGIRYSDGSLVRPQDFRRSLERSLRLGVASASVQKIVGARRCRKARCDLSEGVAASGDSLVIRTTEPTPRLPIDLSFIYPIPRGTPMRDVGTKPVPGTAPYMIESYAPARERTRRSRPIRGQVTLVRNPHFHVWSEAARPDGYPDEIVLRLGAIDDRAVQQVLSGKADVLLAETPADRIADLRASHPRQLHVGQQHATAFLYMNTRAHPFDDIRVRRAVNYAVDRDAVANMYGGPELAQPTCQLVPPALTGYKRYCPYTVGRDESGRWKAPDLARARRLIAVSGTRGDRVVVWTFKPTFSKQGRYFVSLFRKLGYRAQLKELPDLGTYFKTIRRAHPQSGLAGIFGLTVGTDILHALACDSPVNWARFCDPGFDRLVARSEREYANDAVGAAQLTERIDRDFVRAAPWVPLFTPKFGDLVSARVGNYEATGNGPLLDQIWVRRPR